MVIISGVPFIAKYSEGLTGLGAHEIVLVGHPFRQQDQQQIVRHLFFRPRVENHWDLTHDELSYSIYTSY
jgi:hypothetical protein